MLHHKCNINRKINRETILYYSGNFLCCESPVCYICEYMLVNEVTLMNQPKQTDIVKKKNTISPFQSCKMNEDFITTSLRHSDSLCVSPRHTHRVPSQ